MTNFWGEGVQIGWCRQPISQSPRPCPHSCSSTCVSSPTSRAVHVRAFLWMAFADTVIFLTFSPQKRCTLLTHPTSPSSSCTHFPCPSSCSSCDSSLTLCCSSLRRLCVSRSMQHSNSATITQSRGCTFAVDWHSEALCPDFPHLRHGLPRLSAFLRSVPTVSAYGWSSCLISPHARNLEETLQEKVTPGLPFGCLLRLVLKSCKPSGAKVLRPLVLSVRCLANQFTMTFDASLLTSVLRAPALLRARVAAVSVVTTVFRPARFLESKGSTCKLTPSHRSRAPSTSDEVDGPPIPLVSTWVGLSRLPTECNIKRGLPEVLLDYPLRVRFGRQHPIARVRRQASRLKVLIKTFQNFSKI